MRIRKVFALAYLLIPVVLSASCANPSKRSGDETWKRTALAARAFPDGYKYMELPAADNAVSGFMVRSLVGSGVEASWMKDLESVMADGEKTPTYLVVGSKDDGVAYASVKSALKVLSRRHLTFLHLGLIGDPRQAESLRPTVEALGAEYRVLSSNAE